ncbi:histidine kinase [Nostoc linckia z18]|uniref:histidine kinase n=1 Tax=Nostoc linckia z7 TaxID=1628745 RepID=A0ABX4KDJ1_NOSLI|nr:ATP-binding protein [Nostoc linckia]PHK31379.1 histidine kinase [Nostoc linckia z15]PHK40292.1 histidine kinase [Nostoc linckia z16]PHJ56751.1 histidine kinase [Nostoc linckia z1]PHJ57367.1 histidine kinase [Nostoc linckia z2]PHJ62350.1 histidine kinase [Nostoc linckia z3]
MTILFSLEIHYEQDVVQARQRTREIAEQLGFDAQDQARLATAVSEIARNAFQYAKGGTLEFSIEGEPQGFVIRVEDRGEGIPHLADILAGRDTSSTGMKLGIVGTRRLMDFFEIESLPGQGTTVVMSKKLSKRTATFSDSQLQQIRETVIGRSPQNPYEEIQRQNQELLRAMAELQKREEELIYLNRELEDTNRGVVALYAELDEKADSLQKANELKTRFLSNMSHEFRTPLNSILSLSRMLLARMDGDLTAEQEKQVTFIQKAASGLSELVNDLLDLAKVEAGKIEVRPSYFKVSDLFATLRGMLRPLLVQGSSVTLIVEEPNAIPPLYTDEGKVAQILRNFVSNALKFTEQGEVRVSAMQTGHTVTFSVSDTGIGIAASDRERIFEDFVQIESPLQKQVKGTGLGLPLSRKLAELLGGNISIKSELGQGSTFTASIPIVYPHTTEFTTLDQPAPLEPNRLPILAVEDHPETLFIYEKHLQESTYQLIPTRTLAQARLVLQQVRPTAIMLDIMLEGQNGWTFLRELKGDATTRSIPVLVITIIDNEKQALALGADGFLIKPADRLPLLNKLNTLINKNSLQKILLIDDDPAYRYLVKQLLVNTQLSILEAANGQEGLNLAEHERPSAIVLDLEMPEIGGFDVLQQLKNNSVTQSIPVIIHSSAQLDVEVQRLLAKQSIAILSKETGSQTAAIAQLEDALIKAGIILDAWGESNV